MHFLVTSYRKLCWYIIHTKFRGNTHLKPRNSGVCILGGAGGDGFTEG